MKDKFLELVDLCGDNFGEIKRFQDKDGVKWVAKTAKQEVWFIGDTPTDAVLKMLDYLHDQK